MYSGSGLRGYGNLIIVQHNQTYLTAYGHNQRLLVREGQTVRRGQSIATMGNSDSQRVQLHFELRKNGQPVDPLQYHNKEQYLYEGINQQWSEKVENLILKICPNLHNKIKVSGGVGFDHYKIVPKIDKKSFLLSFKKEYPAHKFDYT